MAPPLRPIIIIHLMRSTMFSSDVELDQEPHRQAIHRAHEFSFTYSDCKHITNLLSSPKPHDVEIAQTAFAPVLERGVGLNILPPLSDEYAAAAHNEWSKTEVHISQVIEQLAISSAATLLLNFDESRGEEKREMIEVAVVTNGNALRKMVGRFQPSYWGPGRANTYITGSFGLLVPIGNQQLKELRAQHPRKRRFAARKIILAIFATIGASFIVVGAALAII
ncbi:hypothetical protein BDZ45DRAFT_744069 [Acephala macrosclerotiorum]|nr:hypothetical protein BDZ45DRAFT_744069 [Acephala macrosclerotiorum]